MSTSSATAYSVCGSSFYDNGGSAGNYSNSIAFSEQYVYTSASIASSTDYKRIKVTINSCQIGVGDTLYIYDVARTYIPQNTESLIAKLTGTISGTSYVSRNQGLVFRFKSDATINGSGWDISLTCFTTFKKSAPCLSILFTNPILATL